MHESTVFLTLLCRLPLKCKRLVKEVQVFQSTHEHSSLSLASAYILIFLHPGYYILGTWSDGKLTTRIGRNSEPVRFVLETLVNYGAPKRILVEGAPHLGTDNLVRLLRNMREDLKLKGGEIHFGCRASKFDIKDGIITSVEAESSDEGLNVNAKKNVSFNQLDAVVLATGHSARDVYQELYASGVELEAKGFAVGFRIEHPQRIINEIQYGKGKHFRAYFEVLL